MCTKTRPRKQVLLDSHQSNNELDPKWEAVNETCFIEITPMLVLFRYLHYILVLGFPSGLCHLCSRLQGSRTRRAESLRLNQYHQHPQLDRGSSTYGDLLCGPGNQAKCYGHVMWPLATQRSWATKFIVVETFTRKLVMLSWPLTLH